MTTGRPKPSEIDLAFPHFVGCAGRAEREFALGLYVRACEVKGDRWQPIAPRDMGEVLRADREGDVEPWAKLSGNPFWFPDVRDLVTAGYARYVNDDEHAPIELTDEGFGAVDKWIAKVGRRRTG